METFGGRVQSLRMDKGLGVREFARAAEISPPFVVDIEASRRMPAPDAMGRMAEVLDVPLVDLQVLDPRLPEGRDALRLALVGEWDALLDQLAGLDDGFLERLAVGAGELQAAAGEVLGRRHG